MKNGTRDKGHLKLVVNEGQRDLFREEQYRCPSIDSLVRAIETQGKDLVNIRPGYGINNETLKPFFNPVSFNERKEFQLSFFDHFLASKHLYNGIFAMEDHSEIGLIKGRGIPHEVLTRLRPSEIVSVYIMSYTAKYKDRSWYNLLLGLPSNKIIKKLTNEGIQRYNAVRMMKKGEDKAREYAPLDSRLASLSNDGKNKFYEAFRTKQLSVREPYRTGPFTSENSERFYQYGIDTFVPKIIEVFQDIYKLKTIKP